MIRSTLAFWRRIADNFFVSMNTNRTGSLLMMRIVIFVSFLICLVATPVWGAPPMEQFAIWDSRNNGERNFDNPQFDLEHIEFPVDHPSLYILSNYGQWFSDAAIKKGPHAVIIDFADYLPKDIGDAFLFRKNGVR